MGPGNLELPIAENQAQLVTYPPTVPVRTCMTIDAADRQSVLPSPRVARAPAMCSRKNSIRSVRINFYNSVVASLVGCAISRGVALYAEPDISHLTFVHDPLNIQEEGVSEPLPGDSTGLRVNKKSGGPAVFGC
jgi:hypothetical protein